MLSLESTGGGGGLVRATKHRFTFSGKSALARTFANADPVLMTKSPTAVANVASAKPRLGTAALPKHGGSTSTLDELTEQQNINVKITTTGLFRRNTTASRPAEPKLVGNDERSFYPLENASATVRPRSTSRHSLHTNQQYDHELNDRRSTMSTKTIRSPSMLVSSGSATLHSASRNTLSLGSNRLVVHHDRNGAFVVADPQQLMLNDLANLTQRRTKRCFGRLIS